MDLTTFDNLKRTTFVNEKKNGINVFIPSSWVVDGENRVSYTTIIRVVECCREYHWNKDMKNKNIDSICGSINAKFIKPIEVNVTIYISYSIKDISDNKYKLLFNVTDENGETYCFIEMISFFYNPFLKKTIKVSKDMIEGLKKGEKNE